MKSWIRVAVTILVIAAPALAEEPPPQVTRTLEQAMRIAAEAIIKEDWKALAAVGPTAADVQAMEAAFAGAGDSKENAEQLAGMRAFAKKHGGYEGAATKQRQDLVARAKSERARVAAQVDWSAVAWSRYLPIRRHVVRSRPFELREECFALEGAIGKLPLELVFAGHVVRGKRGWTYVAGLEFREMMGAGDVVEKPGAKTHPFAGLWTGVEAGPLQRDVTLWLRPMEQANRYIARGLISQETKKGTSVSATRITGIYTGTTAGKTTLRWHDGFLAYTGKLLQGRLREHPVALRPVRLDKLPAALTRKVSLELQGTTAVSTPSLAKVRRSSFVLAMQPGPRSAIAIEIHTGERADPAVDEWVKTTVGAIHTGAAIVGLGGIGKPYFELVKHRHAFMFRLVWHGEDRFGPMPTIVHGYAPTE